MRQVAQQPSLAMTAPDAISALLHVWNEETGQELNARAVERLFWEFHQCGFTPDDLRLVLRYWQRQNRQASEARYRKAISAVRVMRDLEEFASILGLARAEERNRVRHSPRQAILNATGRTETKTGDTARPAKAVVAEALRGIVKELE
jgi:hypothetical protein